MSGRSSFRTTVSGPNLYTTPGEMLIVLADGLLFNVIDRLPESKGYTILYVTSPRELEDTGSDFYQAEQDPLHMDLKRDYSAHDSQSSSNKTLFQEYQFFTPGM